MSAIQTRKERERAERHQRIIDTARDLAEAQGWEAVTVRKLADSIEYSQPVLYSHFAGKDAIVAAVAEQGFADMGAEFRRLRTAAPDAVAALTAVAQGYLEFARAHPALYDAMFVMKVDLHFGPDAVETLRSAFGELVAVFAPYAGASDPEAFTEVAWSALHGLATLDRGGRLRPDFRDQRLEILVRQWTGGQS
ncbi:TetR/AcrR family transcriptional regulator [Nocardia sp. NPDC050406]|uniref:TetR/AcrR family transcriptional regulator n=1 Tax=Nocardia sp. NPDC050406 TaxID=3364318 RepID=UPI0037B3151C